MKKLWQRRPPKPDIEKFNKPPYRKYPPLPLGLIVALICLLTLFGGLWLGNRVAKQGQLGPADVVTTTIYRVKPGKTEVITKKLPTKTLTFTTPEGSTVTRTSAIPSVSTRTLTRTLIQKVVSTSTVTDTVTNTVTETVTTPPSTP